MTKEVQIIIQGMDLDSMGENITSKASGIYHYQNGKHIIQYEERSKEDGVVVRNLLKLSPKQLVIKKDGGYHSQMIFDLSEITSAQYGTPYGDLTFHIHTKELTISEVEDEIKVSLRYSLSNQDNILSQNQVILQITPTYLN